MESIKYRPEIDGLRAVAVLPVIFYHAGFELFSGGFVGVDVFFVISGYLITSIILKEMERGEFSIARFYERRARRILPALIFMVACCIPFAWLWMTPDELQRFGNSLISVAAFSSNFYFWQAQDYFAPAAELQPLLHTWSLAVEEQYYLVAPLALLMLWRYRKEHLLRFVITTGIASFLLAEWGWRNHPSANFYMLPTRAWELLIGTAIGVAHHNNQWNDSKPGVSWIGAAMILLAVFFYDKDLPSPSIFMLMPTIGAGLVIAHARQDSGVGSFLSCGPLVKIGLMSYGAYLWHQPVLAFTKLSRIGDIGFLLLISLCALSFLAAAISLRFIESPLRKQTGERPQLFKASVLSILLVIFTGLSIEIATENTVKPISQLELSLKRTIYGCFEVSHSSTNEKWLCDINKNKNSKVDFLMIGDSHMNALVPGVRLWAKHAGVSGRYVGYNSCLPLLGVYLSGIYQHKERNCHDLNSRAYEYVRENNIKNIILVSRWSFYIEGGYERNIRTFLSNDDSLIVRTQNNKDAFIRGVSKTIKEYNDIGTNVIVIFQVPEQVNDPRDVYEAYHKSPIKKTIVDLSVDAEINNKLQEQYMGIFKKESYLAKVSLINLTKKFCKESKCLIGNEDYSYYYDDDHISEFGAILAAEALMEKLSLSATGIKKQPAAE